MRGCGFRSQSSKASGDTCRCAFSTTETVAHWWPTTHAGPDSQPPVSGPKGQVRTSAAHLNLNYQGAREASWV